MSGFKKGQLKAAFTAKGTRFSDEEHTSEIDKRRAIGKWAVEVEPKPNQAKAEKLKELDANYARRAGEEEQANTAPGRIATAAAATKAHLETRTRKKEKDVSETLRRLEQQRKDMERQLEWLINWYEKQAEKAREKAAELKQKIVDNTERMIENSNFIGEIDKILKAHKNGQPINKEKLRKLLKEEGADIDDSTPLAVLLHTAKDLVIKADDENKHLEIDNDIYEKEAEGLEAEAVENENLAKETKAKLDNLKSQNLSDEEYDREANKIWDNAPYEASHQYETGNELNSIDNEKGKMLEVKSKAKEEVSTDPMAGFFNKPELPKPQGI